MCGKELTDVFTKHTEYVPIPTVEEAAIGKRIFSFTNDCNEYVTYSEYNGGSFIATYTDHHGVSHHFRVNPQISLRVSTLVVNRYGYVLVEDTTDIGFMQESAES